MNTNLSLKNAFYIRHFKNNIVTSMLYDYKCPNNLSYFWNFGSLAGICLTIQLATGIFLAMHYTPHIDYAFISVEHIMRDVNYGWLLRYIHANGASMFFIVLYMHIFRGLYYCSYNHPRELVWYTGVTIFIVTMASAFIGYVLPWGQMSLWGATVITNLISAIPIIGTDIVYWVWGGFSIDNPTLNRFFSFHYLFPFIVALIVFIHLDALHGPKSGNPLGVELHSTNNIAFHPFFTTKDIVGGIIFLFLFAYLVFFNPNALGHPDNYIPANSLVTPAHIVPEWYFLPYYAILRSIPSKLGGVAAMGLSLVIFYFLPKINNLININYSITSHIHSGSFRPIYNQLIILFIVNGFILGYIGQCPVEEPFYTIGQISTILYFLCIFLIPITYLIETWLIHKYYYVYK